MKTRYIQVNGFGLPPIRPDRFGAYTVQLAMIGKKLVLCPTDTDIIEPDQITQAVIASLWSRVEELEGEES